jgi:putative transposase
MCFHRPLPAQATLKHAVVKRVNERWYVCLMLETPIPEPVLQRLPTGQQIGVDVGLKSLLALSNGELIENPQWLKNSLSKLRRVQRHAARQEKSSHRQRKTYARIARLHEQITHQRRDYLTAEFDLIAVEDLTLAFMNRNEHLSLASHDAGLGELRHLLTYKAEEAGRQLVAVNPANTSQRCSGCGRIVPKGLGCEFTNVLLVV